MGASGNPKPFWNTVRKPSVLVAEAKLWVLVEASCFIERRQVQFQGSRVSNALRWPDSVHPEPTTHIPSDKEAQTDTPEAEHATYNPESNTNMHKLARQPQPLNRT